MVGYLKIAFGATCPVVLPKPCPEFTTLYVLEKFLGQGIGHQLLREGLLALKALNFSAVWLSVYFENDRALSFYRKNLFMDINQLFFPDTKN